MTERKIEVGLQAAIIAVTNDEPRLLIVDEPGLQPVALPYGPLAPDQHRTLERGLRASVKLRTGLDLAYVEQLYTFGDQVRDAREPESTTRTISCAYLALVNERSMVLPATARFVDVYAFLPWEDWRQGPPVLIERDLAPALDQWAGGDVARGERVALCFGIRAAAFDPERTLERYELLWEAGLVAEAGPRTRSNFGAPMALDHRRITATALGRLRGKIRYRPVIFELLPETFTLLKLQKTVEALAGTRLHKQNLRRLVEQQGLVEATGERDERTGGRPAALFRFRREVYRERPQPGVLFPGAFRAR